VHHLFKLGESFGSHNFNLVLGEHVFEIRDLLLRFVSSAQHLGKEQLMSLNVAVDVDIVHTLKLE